MCEPSLDPHKSRIFSFYIDNCNTYLQFVSGSNIVIVTGNNNDDDDFEEVVLDRRSNDTGARRMAFDKLNQLLVSRIKEFYVISLKA